MSEGPRPTTLPHPLSHPTVRTRSRPTAGTRAVLNTVDCLISARRLNVEGLNSVVPPSRPPSVRASGRTVKAVCPISTGSTSVPRAGTLSERQPITLVLRTATAANPSRMDIHTATDLRTPPAPVSSARPIRPPSDSLKVRFEAGPFWNDTTKIRQRRMKTTLTAIDITAVTAARSRTAGLPVEVRGR
jgi:hypothetical protein